MSSHCVFDDTHLRLLWLIYENPDGITARDLVEKLKMNGWCEPWLEPGDLGLEPDDIVRRPAQPPERG